MIDFNSESWHQTLIRVKPNRPQRINIVGNRDPRGWDNSIYVWLDENDELHILVWKAERCYQFDRIEEGRGFIEMVQV
jgi:hypothetical protein